MKIETSVKWLYALEDNLHPSVLANTITQKSDFSDLLRKLKKNIQEFRPYFLNAFGRSKLEAKAILLQLIVVSDAIHNYKVGMAATWKDNVFSDDMDMFYRQALSRLERLFELYNKLDEELLSDVPLTAFAVSNVRMELRKGLNSLKSTLSKSHLEPALRDLILIGLKQIIERQGISRANAKYASMIIGELEKLSPLNTVEVENLLYQYDFNAPSYFNYCAKCSHRLLEETPSLHAQLEILFGLEDRINGLPAKSSLRWMPVDKSVRDQLRDFFREKKQYIQQRIELRRLEIQDSRLVDEADRMQINLPVAQFGLCIRLFMEKGLLPKEDVGKTFSYYARYFRTPKTPFISAESLQKKSTDVEFATAKKMKGHLIGMVNWLNEHYNTSTHRDL